MQKAGVSNNNFDQQKEQFCHYSRVVAHPVRIEVLKAIVKAGNDVQGGIVAVDGVSPTTVIQHLREMKRAGLIGGRIFGAKAHYWIEKENLLQYLQLMDEFRVWMTPILES